MYELFQPLNSSTFQLFNPFPLSQAFVKEGDEQWLHDVQPTLNALVVYLSRENNGVRVYEVRGFMDPKSGRDLHEMSNGLTYGKDADGRWEIIW